MNRALPVVELVAGAEIAVEHADALRGRWRVPTQPVDAGAHRGLRGVAVVVDDALPVVQLAAPAFVELRRLAEGGELRLAPVEPCQLAVHLDEPPPEPIQVVDVRLLIERLWRRLAPVDALGHEEDAAEPFARPLEPQRLRDGEIRVLAERAIDLVFDVAAVGEQRPVGVQPENQAPPPLLPALAPDGVQRPCLAGDAAENAERILYPQLLRLRDHGLQVACECWLVHWPPPGPDGSDGVELVQPRRESGAGGHRSIRRAREVARTVVRTEVGDDSRSCR